MEILTSFRKLTKEGLHKAGNISEFYTMMLLLLTCLSMSNINVKAIIGRMASAMNVIGPLSIIFQKIKSLTEKWSYGLHDAYSTVLEDVRDKKVRGMLLRMGQTIKVGANISEFAKIEFERFMSTSEAEFDRCMERLKRFSEAYSALLTSFAFLSVSMLLTSMIYGGARPEQILITSALMMLVTLTCVIFLIFRNSIKFPVLHSLKERPKNIAKVEKLILPTLIGSILITVIIGVIPIYFDLPNPIYLLYPVPLPFLIGSVAPIVVGLLGKKVVSQVKEIEVAFLSFIKALADSLSVTSSLKLALKPVMLNDYGKLTGLIKRLMNRLKAGFDAGVCLYLFGVESGSKTVASCSSVLGECIRSGAKASIYGKVLGDYTNSVLIRRNKRAQVAGNLKGVIIPLQATLSSVLALIKVLTGIFRKLMQMVSPYVSIIQVPPELTVNIYFFSVILAVTIGSSLAIYFVEGESRFTLLTYLGLLMIISAASFLAVSFSVESLFRVMFNVEELGSLVEVS
ncbi:MAG: hypothetical protein QXE40_03455 [Nitrososphaerota archaeon]